MKNRITKIFVFVGIFMIIGGFLSQFIINLKNDRKATLAQMDDVKGIYKKFSDDIDYFNDVRNDLYLNVFDNTYYATMIDTDFSVKETFTDYEKTVDSISELAEKLKKVCNGVYYPEASVNNKCKSFSNVYEQIVNAFVSDVNLYNDNITNFNTYQKENGNIDMLTFYKTTKKFIDYDKDKKYDGKE